MLGMVQSAGLYGLEGYPVAVECALSPGLPRLDVVGLPDTAVREAGDRVRAAVQNSGYAFPVSRITVNLAPADTRKEGSLYDLPILLSILAASGQLAAPLPPDSAFLGEVSLGGVVRPISGALSMAMALAQRGVRQLYLPAENGPEAALASEHMAVYPVPSLPALLAHLEGRAPLTPSVAPAYRPQWPEEQDFAFVMGQEQVKRALEVAASGGHNILLCGSPGSGKSLMAKCLQSILPPLSRPEWLEVVRIHSVCGEGARAARRGSRPFLTVHHTASPASLVGGSGQAGRLPRPGQISQAHHGVLFLDELPEFRRDTLEALRQPMEDGRVTISRVAGTVTYPSRFMLVCAMNPCRCGWYGHPSGRCRCTKEQVRQYLSRLSGPLLDRIDLQVDVQPVEYEALRRRERGEPSAAIRQRVLAARARQRARMAGTGIQANAYIPPARMAQFCPLTDGAEEMMRQAFDRLGLTARAHDRVLRVARTIADLDGAERIDAPHVAEAIQYRSLERRA